MHILKAVYALALVGVVAGCYPRTQTEYDPDVFEQPQPVHFFYGTLIAPPRQVSLEYNRIFGIGAAFYGTSPYVAGVVVGGSGGSGGLGAAFAGRALVAAGSVPSLPAVEYTVMPDWGTNPPDPYVRIPGAAAVIVVQNVQPGDPPMGVGQRVVVRVVGKSGRVMADPLLPGASARLAAGPLPIPLPCPPSVTDCSAPYVDPPPAPPLPPYLPTCRDRCDVSSNAINPM
jgi:hypothetical protein